ncbi:MAG: hypothetical protein K2K76_01790 [Muribaculaceae bacterium]|nr:hypothetical protein [Muribaculaceae bacterium]
MAFLVLIGALVLVGAVLRLLHHEEPSVSETSETSVSVSDTVTTGEPEICCGLHEICSKSAQRAGEIVYFDDEELDRFSQRADDDQYTSAEVEEFRDILMTLPVGEIAQWQESLAMRKIPVPAEIRDEMIILLDEIALTAGKTSNS